MFLNCYSVFDFQIKTFLSKLCHRKVRVYHKKFTFALISFQQIRCVRKHLFLFCKVLERLFLTKRHFMNMLLSHCSLTTKGIILQKKRKDIPSQHTCNGYQQYFPESSTNCISVAKLLRVLFSPSSALSNWHIFNPVYGFVCIALMLSILEQVACVTVYIQHLRN